jgi:hypothetical protein
MRLFSLLVVPVLVALPAAAQAQVTSTGLISPEATRQLGLERMWFTHLHVDRGRGRIAGLHVHVSNSEAHTVFQFTYNGQRYVFSQRDLDAFGKEVGVEGAKQLADKKLEAIKSAQQAANKQGPLPEIETFVVPKITLYSASERGTLHSLDAETGRTHWTKSVGRPEHPTTAPSAGDKYVGVCNGSSLFILLASDGSQVWSRDLVGAPGAGPALTEDQAFVPMISGKVETFNLAQPKRPVAIYQSFGRAMVQPVVSFNSVAWPTDGGNLYVGLAREPGMRFRMQAKDAINSAPAFLGDKVFATSLDGYLYCVHERRGNVLWRFTTGEPISHSPIALDKTVYAITDRGNMFAIGVADGQEQWVQSGIRSYVAGNNKRLYCIDVGGNLTTLEAATGSKLGSIAIGQMDMPYMNVETDRIILAASTGLVQCFREASLPWPVLHFKTDAVLNAAGATVKTTPTPEPAAGGATPMPPAADPFGGPAKPGTPPTPAGGAPDPFGAPKPATPAPGTPPATPNPFG